MSDLTFTDAWGREYLKLDGLYTHYADDGKMYTFDGIAFSYVENDITYTYNGTDWIATGATEVEDVESRDVKLKVLRYSEKRKREDDKSMHHGGVAAIDSSMKMKKKKKDEAVDVTLDDEGHLQLAYNTVVFIDHLPLDTDKDELAEFAKKAGVIKMNKDELCIRLYEKDDKLTGGATVAYERIESVVMAMEALDGSQYRPGHPVTVTEAKFKAKADFQPGKNKVKRKHKSTRRKWGMNDEEDEGPCKEKTQLIIIKNLFTLEESLKDYELIKDIKDDIKDACEPHGETTKFTLYENHPEGVISLKYSTVRAGEKLIAALNGKMYNGHILDVGYWDKTTDYRVAESEELKEMRKKAWDEFLNHGEAEENSDADSDGWEQ